MAASPFTIGRFVSANIRQVRRTTTLWPTIEHRRQASTLSEPITEDTARSFKPPNYRTLASDPLALSSHGPYWNKISLWKDVSESQFSSYEWQRRNTIERKEKLLDFLQRVLPERIPQPKETNSRWRKIQTRDDFLRDVVDGMRAAPMAVRLTPYTLSVADWNNPLEDPIRRQFIPLKSLMLPDHPKLTFDSLNEKDDSPVKGLVHRYPDKALFLAVAHCPVYCRFCTRSYAVGPETEMIKKTPTPPGRSRWAAMFQYLANTPQIQDVVVSGGDSYSLEPHQLRSIGECLLSMPHIRRTRFATKGLAVCPVRILDPADAWTSTFIDIVAQGRQLGKEVAMHTHFNHPNEITWHTELAAQYLFRQGVTVRNQTVLLHGVNDDFSTMSSLIHRLANLNIKPYYVYQSDMVRGVEDLRTPLSTILDLDQRIRGTIAGFMTPSFVVDLPGGGGKRLAASFETYDETTGISTFKAPGVAPDEVFTYHDPLPMHNE